MIDEATFTDLVREHRAALIALSRRLSSDRDMAEDVVADVFERLWRRRDTVSMDVPWAYLSRAVRNEVVDRFRARAREQAALHLAAAEPGERTRPDDAVDARDLVNQLLATLSDPQRRTVSLRYIADLSEAETAVALSLPTGTVKSHASRAIHRMRQTTAAA